tara:strand:+ start:1676 stop:1933 length:258 start_codon:yes stop_codon:yes gene_type:complete
MGATKVYVVIDEGPGKVHGIVVGVFTGETDAEGIRKTVDGRIEKLVLNEQRPEKACSLCGGTIDPERCFPTSEGRNDKSAYILYC